MLTKSKILRLTGILLIAIFPISGGLFSERNVVHAQTKPPILAVDYAMDWVITENWPIGTVLTLKIDDQDPATNPYSITRTY